MMKRFLLAFIVACLPSGVFAVSWDDGAINGCVDNNTAITLYEHSGGEVNFMAAVEYNSYGVKLCPIGAGAWRDKTTQRPWIEWRKLSKNADCFWMCTEGWTGNECTTKVTDGMVLGRNCNSMDLAGIDYAVSHTNVVASPKIFAEDHIDCKGESDMNPWHYAVPGVTRFTPDGHGAFVAELTVRSCYNKGKKEYDDCGVKVNKSTNTQEKLVCMIGYKPNADKTGCEEIDKVACAGLCPAFMGVEDLFVNDAEYSVKYDEQQECMTFICAQSGYGFAGDPRLVDFAANRKCIECKSTDTEIKTVLPDGQCYVLKTGESISAVDGVSVVKAVDTEKTLIKDMLKKDSHDCWKESRPEDYQKCILGLAYGI